MPKQIIDLWVETDSTWKVEVSGVTGKACKVLTLPLETDLGGKTKMTEKPEYHKVSLAIPKGIKR